MGLGGPQLATPGEGPPRGREGGGLGAPRRRGERGRAPLG